MDLKNGVILKSGVQAVKSAERSRRFLQLVEEAEIPITAGVSLLLVDPVESIKHQIPKN
jgi:hypothetical protein